MQTVNNLDELLAALKAGEREFCTPPNALNYLGAGYLVAMIAEAKKDCADFILWCDAGDNAAVAMAAIQCGLKHIIIQTSESSLHKLQQMANQVGAVVRSA